MRIFVINISKTNPRPPFLLPDSSCDDMGALKQLVTTVSVIFIGLHTDGQVLIHGTVYNRAEGKPLSGVSVLSVSGAGTSTDSLGHYQIRLAFTDSLYCSWLGKATARFAVKDIPADQAFDLDLNETNSILLPAFSVIGGKDYYRDSVSNRAYYSKAFGYTGRDGLQDRNPGQTGGVGFSFDLDNLINPSADNRAQALQQRLQEDERDKYIDHKFNRPLVKKITGLETPLLDSFMRVYRPSFEQLHVFGTDYEYYEWISTSAKSFMEAWKMEP
jgi:hypothetical protein